MTPNKLAPSGEEGWQIYHPQCATLALGLFLTEAQEESTLPILSPWKSEIKPSWKMPRRKEHSYRQRWGVEAKRTVQTETCSNNSYLLWSPHIFKLLFHNASLFNPVYKLLGVATSLGLHFPMEALIYR